MDDGNVNKAHWSFWPIGVVALIWNAAGAINFVIQMNPDMLQMYRETERAIILNRPGWATIAFAVAVFGGTAGAVLLLMKKSLAFYLFVASLAGVVITTLHTLRLDIQFAVAEIIGIVLAPLVVPAFLTWYSTFVSRKGWTR